MINANSKLVFCTYLFTFQGKFVFKNGRIYEGMFECDHIVEFPDFQMDGLNTPDLTQIRTRTPLPSGTVFFLLHVVQYLDYCLKLLARPSFT